MSVIMPVYNAADFLEESINSIVNQTYKNWELIIVNDASTDGSLSIIKDFLKKYPQKIKVKNLRRNLNRGGDPAANEGFSLAKGELVARMDADDVALPGRLENQVKYMLIHKEVFMLGGQAKVIDKRGRVMGQKRVPLGNGRIYEDFFMFNPVIHPTVMLRKNEVKGQKLYRIEYSANNDLLTFFEFLKAKKIANLDKELICYRVHEKNDSYTNIKEKFFNTLKIRLKAVREFGYRPSLKAWTVTVCQLIVIGLMPAKVALKLYLIAKGISSPVKELKKFLPKWIWGDRLAVKV